MNFYKSIDIATGKEIFINPKLIEKYTYNCEYVRIRFSSGLWSEIDKSDFENMMCLEGVMEYWNTRHTIEYQLTIKTKLFY